MNRIHTTRATDFKAFFVLLLLGAFLHPTALATPDAGDAVAAWYAARNWVDATATDVAVDDPGVPLVKGATACCVILRFDGRLVGLGTAEEDPADMVRLATMRALEDALDDQTISALPEDLRGDAGKRLTLELELAGELEPLIGTSIVELDSDIHPLHHGLGLRWGTRWAYRYPCRLRLVNNWAKASRLESMGIGLGLTPRAAVEGMRRGDVAPYRFEVLGLAQPTPGAPPMEVVAGSIGVHDMPDMKSLSDARLQLLDHVIGTLWPGEESIGVMGPYEPSTDRYKPLIASNLDQALTAYALARASNDEGIGHERSDEAVRVAATIIDILSESEDLEKSSAEHASFLLALGSMQDIETSEAIDLHRDAAIGHFEKLLEDTSTANAVDSHALGMASLAMTRMERQETARALADRAWASTPVERHVSLMPWIAWTELALAGDDCPAHAEKLAGLRAVLHDRQVPSGDDRFGDELVGGFVLGQDPVDVDAQSLRPAAAMPAMLLSNHLTEPGERLHMMNRLNALGGFLLRLQMSTEGASLHRNPERGIGGIRMAFWDNRMPPAVQVMALLALQELLAIEDVQSIVPAEDPELY